MILLVIRIIPNFWRTDMTKQKLIISQIVENSCGHPTAEEIYLEAKKFLPSIAVGTVYRNLNRMVADGEIRRISIPGKADSTSISCRIFSSITDFDSTAILTGLT